jgi:HK97 family phage prohead protease
MPDYLRAFRSGEPTSDDGPLLFTASSEVMARDGMVVLSDGWDLKNFARNNLVLWGHDYFGNRPPIGKARAYVDSKAKELKAEITFDLEDVFAKEIYRKYKSGFANAVSVGFNILETDESGRTATKTELLEISCVPIPADPKALMERQQRGLTHDLTEILTRLTNTETPTLHTDLSELVWRGTALSMARLYLDATGDDDETREAEYRRLTAQYRALGKEPPEWMARSQLSLLDNAQIHGLFGSGEADLLGWEPDGARKGAVLSARNLGDLDQIIGLAQAIKERATREQETDQDDAERAFLQRFMPKPTEPDDFLRRLAG